MNEPSFYDGGHKTNKVNKFFQEKQLTEFIRVKIVIILIFRNEKVISVVFYVKDVNKTVP